jgi:hypothetical protein
MVVGFRNPRRFALRNAHVADLLMQANQRRRHDITTPAIMLNAMATEAAKRTTWVGIGSRKLDGPTSQQIALDHHPNNAALASLHLLGNVFDNARLVLGILAAVGVTSVLL